MALDGIFLHSILLELKNDLLNSKIDKVNQPEKDELILTIRCKGSNKKLLISSSSNYPRIHFTTMSKSNPMQPPMFCMVLRKYLIGGRILDIRQLAGDRIIVMDIENSDELGFNSMYSLIIEIMGRHSNITLVRQRDNIVMDSIKHITPDINSYRSLYPNLKYVYPPASDRLNPFTFTKEEFLAFFIANGIEQKDNMFSKLFTGVSSLLSKELFFRLSKENCDMTETAIWEFLSEFLSSLKDDNFKYSIYSLDNAPKYFYCIPLTHLQDLNSKDYSTPSVLLETFYFEKDKIDRLNSKSADLQKLINNNIDRCNKKSQILTSTLKECEDKDNLRLYGELLTANIFNVHKGDSFIKALNYYSENGDEYITIKLDENKTPSENIQLYFKKYNKYKKSAENALEQLENNEIEANYLQSVMTNIKNCESYEEIEEIRIELVETGYIKFKKSGKNNKLSKHKPLKPFHYVSSDNIDIYIGKNNVQNDYLTLKFADKNDTWLHTKDIPGSHVIIKHIGEIPENTLIEAAKLAAYYSKAKDSSKVPVDYTLVKNVKKPSGSKPGMVIYSTNKTIFINPEKLS